MSDLANMINAIEGDVAYFNFVLIDTVNLSALLSKKLFIYFY